MAIDITHPGFVSAKCRVPILYPRRWHRDAIVQIVLDHRVAMISPCESNDDFMIEITFTTGMKIKARFVDVAPRRQSTEISSDLVIKRAIALSLPRCAVARELWAQRATVVAVGDRLRIMVLVERAPSIGISIGELASAVRSTNVDAFATVARLICDGLLSVDLDAVLSPKTMVIPGALWPLTVDSPGAKLVPKCAKP